MDVAAMIHRFRTQPPKSRAERQPYQHRAEPSWDGDVGGSWHRASPGRANTNPVDDFIVEDIVRFQAASPQRSVSPGRACRYSPSYSVERTTRTRFRYTPTRDDAAECFGASSPVGAYLSSEMMKGRAELRPSDPPASPKPRGGELEQSTLEINNALESAMLNLTENLNADVVKVPMTPLLDFDVGCEDTPSSINAVREKLEANLTCFNLLYQAKFQAEDDAEEEEKKEKKKQKQELEEKIAAEMNMKDTIRLIEDMKPCGGGVCQPGCQPTAMAGWNPHDPTQILPGAGNPSSQMAAVMESVAQRVRMIEMLQKGELDASDLPPIAAMENAHSYLPNGLRIEHQDLAADPTMAVLMQPGTGAGFGPCGQPPVLAGGGGSGGGGPGGGCGVDFGATGAPGAYSDCVSLEHLSQGLQNDLEITMMCMLKRLNCENIDPPATKGIKGLEMTKEEAKKAAQDAENKKNIDAMETKLDEEDARDREREVDLDSLGGSDIDVDIIAATAPQGGPCDPYYYNWDLIKTQSLDMQEVLRNAPSLTSCNPHGNPHSPLGARDPFPHDPYGEEPVTTATSMAAAAAEADYVRRLGAAYDSEALHSHPGMPLPIPSAPPLPEYYPGLPMPHERWDPLADPMVERRNEWPTSNLRFADLPQEQPTAPAYEANMEVGLSVGPITDARERLERFKSLRQVVEGSARAPPAIAPMVPPTSFYSDPSAPSDLAGMRARRHQFSRQVGVH